MAPTCLLVATGTDSNDSLDFTVGPPMSGLKTLSGMVTGILIMLMGNSGFADADFAAAGVFIGLGATTCFLAVLATVLDGAVFGAAIFLVTLPVFLIAAEGLAEDFTGLVAGMAFFLIGVLVFLTATFFDALTAGFLATLAFLEDVVLVLLAAVFGLTMFARLFLSAEKTDDAIALSSCMVRTHL